MLGKTLTAAIAALSVAVYALSQGATLGESFLIYIAVGMVILFSVVLSQAVRNDPPSESSEKTY